jgi:tetratricopeptide (TPR) repeat protein
VAAGLSLAQVGGVELTRQAVHLIETGKVRPSMRSLRILAHRLHVPVTSLLAPSDSRGPFDQDSVAEIERLCRNHQYEQALARGAEILEWSRSPELIASAHYHIGDALCRLDRPDEAMEHLVQARELFDALDDDRGRVAETMELEALALQIKEDARALTVAREALRRYRESEHRRPEVESRLLQRVGTILTAHRDFGQALRYYDEALQVAGGVRDLMRLARLYHGLAICQQGDGDVRLAADLLFKAHTLYEAEERLADATTGSDLARVENDLAVLLIRKGDLERGEEFLVSSIRRYQEAGLHRRLSSTLLSLAELRQGQGRLDDAADILRQAIDLAGQLQEMQALGAGHRQLGELLAARGEMGRAAESFDRALEIMRDAGLDQRYAECQASRDRALGLSRDSEATGSIA